MMTTPGYSEAYLLLLSSQPYGDVAGGVIFGIRTDRTLRAGNTAAGVTVHLQGLHRQKVLQRRRRSKCFFWGWHRRKVAQRRWSVHLRGWPGRPWPGGCPSPRRRSAGVCAASTRTAGRAQTSPSRSPACHDAPSTPAPLTRWKLLRSWVTVSHVHFLS